MSISKAKNRRGAAQPAGAAAAAVKHPSARGAGRGVHAVEEVAALLESPQGGRKSVGVVRPHRGPGGLQHGARGDELMGHLQLDCGAQGETQHSVVLQ
mmetsp:Transcript_72702/g.168472  ORF Transcript_72702/g.168472 Transcript_72702/m.168472 type:complete len:98 (-) Transcript_72702:92-385(-)